MKRWTDAGFFPQPLQLLPPPSCVQQREHERVVYIGSSAKGDGEGIHVGKWNAASGALSDVRLAFPANSPSFQVGCKSRGTPFLFSGHQPQPTVRPSSFRVETSGDLKVINTVTVADLEESMIKSCSTIPSGVLSPQVIAAARSSPSRLPRWPPLRSRLPIPALRSRSQREAPGHRTRARRRDFPRQSLCAG